MVQTNEAPVNSWGNYDSYQSSEIPRHLISDLHERSYEVPVELHFGLVLYSSGGDSARWESNRP